MAKKCWWGCTMLEFQHWKVQGYVNTIRVLVQVIVNKDGIIVLMSTLEKWLWHVDINYVEIQ